MPLGLLNDSSFLVLKIPLHISSSIAQNDRCSAESANQFLEGLSSTEKKALKPFAHAP
jgi:hypothetical protein